MNPSSLQPYGPVPSPRQLEWHRLEFYGFLHFSINTFTGLEWGHGDESPTQFAPSAFDADQIVETAAAGGMTQLILTCKHHDGFCLWPTRYGEHSVRNCRWQAGKGDVVRAISEACRRKGLKFGVYLSPWDRNYAGYGKLSYLSYYRNQLRELLENYGPISEVWHDGANGGDGYYGGANERRIIDKRAYYDWETTWELVRRLQPGACIFSDGGPDLRWVGNENGIAGETCWATLNRADFAPGEADSARLNQGDRPGTHWVPAECDVSIRPGWFYHAEEDAQVKSPAQLVDLYFASVGRGGALLLNLPPDRRGQIHAHDAAALLEFRRRINRIFTHNLASQIGAAENSALPSPGDAALNPAALLDPAAGAFWTPSSEQRTPAVVLTFPKAVRFNVLDLREVLPLGQRVESFAWETWVDGAWQPLAAGTSIGARRLLRTPVTTTNALRLRITQAAAAPALTGLGIWLDEDCPA